MHSGLSRSDSQYKKVLEVPNADSVAPLRVIKINEQLNVSYETP